MSTDCDARPNACATHPGQSGAAVADLFNSGCFCIGLDQDALRRALESEVGAPGDDGGLFDLLQQRCPHVFAQRPVLLARSQTERMSGLIAAVESVLAMPAYREQVLARDGPMARHDPRGVRGVFFSYDFHAGVDAFGLIEINTNAGGAMLNAVLARAQRACCPELDALLPPPSMADTFEQRMLDMFHQEWSLSGAHRALRSIAIVDEHPQQQYLYPEFLLFQRLFRRHGIEAVIADPGAFELRGGQLWQGALAIDLVYNRLTDFALADAASATLRQAYLANAVVLTPHPQAHALYADKRNLALLTDPAWLDAIGVPTATRDILLAGIARTEIVEPAHAERLWRDRRKLFFKPFAGFGGRAAYRGDKLTRRVWQEILAGGYVAQALVAPGERTVSGQPEAQVLKFDLRAYVYDAQVQWLAARLYQGQTTNFRTPGGGFAPVYQSPF